MFAHPKRMKTNDCKKNITIQARKKKKTRTINRIGINPHFSAEFACNWQRRDFSVINQRKLAIWKGKGATTPFALSSPPLLLFSSLIIRSWWQARVSDVDRWESAADRLLEYFRYVWFNNTPRSKTSLTVRATPTPSFVLQLWSFDCSQPPHPPCHNFFRKFIIRPGKICFFKV